MSPQEQPAAPAPATAPSPAVEKQGPTPFTFEEIQAKLQSGFTAEDLPRLVPTFQGVLAGMGQLGAQVETMQQELKARRFISDLFATQLNGKFAPLRIRQGDIDGLPRKYQIRWEPSPKDGCLEVRLVKPETSPQIAIASSIPT